VGVSIPDDHFDKVEIMKDFEVAMHAIDKVKKYKAVRFKCWGPQEGIFEQDKGTLLLEWINEDSD
jgi:hypothetical protein